MSENALVNLIASLAKESKIINEKKNRLLDDVYFKEPVVVIILSGEVEVADENGTILSLLTKNSMYGISNLFEEEKLKTRLTCNTDSTLMLIKKEEVRDLILTNCDVARLYCVEMNEKVNFLLDRISLLTTTEAKVRFAKYLKLKSKPSFTNRESLAAFLGLSRASLFRTIALLERDGAIKIVGKDFEITNNSILDKIINKGWFTWKN